MVFSLFLAPLGFTYLDRLGAGSPAERPSRTKDDDAEPKSRAWHTEK